MQPYALDLGNGYTKFSRGSTPQMMPSYICEALDPSELCDDIGFGAIIQYTVGDRADLAGRIWAVGEAAKTSFPGAFSRVVDSENSTGKVDFALHFALAGLPPMSHGQYFQIPVMYASLPDPALLGSAFKRAIIGTHRYTHNGVEASATIDDVTVLHEGQGAFVYALSQGVFPSGTANAIIDCGNGTTIAQASVPTGI
jgi:plasmid segregation protein ParM